ncbi:hypothetical protein KKE45_01880, partial [Patescibacteria group bacterium]|nr:hypothetical protein [Patescibacteria group bacterium]
MTRYREGTSGPVTVFVPDDGSLPDQLRYTIKSLQDGYSRKETMTELRKTGLREGKARRLVQVTKPEWINQEGAIGLRQA